MPPGPPSVMVEPEAATTLPSFEPIVIVPVSPFTDGTTSDSFAAGQPPAVAPSWTTTRLLVVSITSSPCAPVKAATCEPVPRRY